LLKAPALRDASVQERFTHLFAQQGIGPDRLILRGPSALADMMQEYGDIDIALDPAPYNGGTTTLQALWMGVPVVTLTGSNFVGRMGTSFLATLGKPAWIAHTEDAYVQTAISLAQPIAALRGQRAQLRAHMADSALCDITRYVQDFEALLQRMWAANGAGQSGRLLGAS
jgi:predicted O-linked N-acetylglucosamine transferase (SPINDLY family)